MAKDDCYPPPPPNPPSSPILKRPLPCIGNLLLKFSFFESASLDDQSELSTVTFDMAEMMGHPLTVV